VSESSQSPQQSSQSSSQGKGVRGRGAAAPGQASGSSGRAGRRRLAPSEKYEVFVQVLTQQATQREAAEKWGVDRSTVIGICRTAKQGALDALAAAVPGRPGRSAEQVELEAARAEIERLRATVTEQGRGAAPAAGKSALGLSHGQVPPRVDAQVKAAVLALVEHARAEAGWSLRKAAETLGLDHVRVLRWQARAALDQLADARPGPEVALHALLDSERDAVVKLAEEWGEIDGSHRKLAHRGSRLDLVHVSESTVLRVLTDAGLHLPGRPPRPPRQRQPFPEWAELVPGVIWIYDFTHFRAAKRCAVAVLDVVSRYWLATVVSAEESSTQIEVAFTKALVADGKEHLLDEQLLQELTHGVVPDDDDRVPVLLAVSDNGPQMTSRATAVFMAGARIAQHFGRPGTPNDQAWIESFFGHLKTEHPHLELIEDSGELEAELTRLHGHYNTVRLHEGIGYVTPEDEHTGRGDAIRAAHQARVAFHRQLRQDPS
jgi:putative transposase